MRQPGWEASVLGPCLLGSFTLPKLIVASKTQGFDAAKLGVGGFRCCAYQLQGWSPPLSSPTSVTTDGWCPEQERELVSST